MQTVKFKFFFLILFSLIVLMPNIFSVIFAILNLPVPSYLFAIIISIIVLIILSVNFNHRNGEFKLIKSSQKSLIFIFYLVVLGSITYSSSLIASKDKVINIAYNSLFPLLIFGGYFFLNKVKSIDIDYFEKKVLPIAYFLLWFSFLIFMLGFKQLYEETDRWILVGMRNPIWFSRFIGLLLFIILYCEKNIKRNYFLFIFSICISIFLFIQAGSRGPLVAVILVFLFKLSFFISKKRLFVYIIAFTALIILGFSFIGGRLFTTGLYSIIGRLDFLNFYTYENLDLIKGHGIGSFGIINYGIDEISYPHNIFLELLFETGFLGILVFLGVIIKYFGSFKLNLINLLVLYCFINSLFSGDLASNNNLFIFLFISIYAKESSISDYSGKYTKQLYTSEPNIKLG